MNLLVGALTIGLILSLLAVGVFITYRVFESLDLTADGSYGFGAAVAGVMLVRGLGPFAATAMGTLAGMLAGTVTGLLHTQLRVHRLLAGILTATALYSVNLYVMHGGDLSLASQWTLVNFAERVGDVLHVGANGLTIFGTTVSTRNWMGLLFTVLLVLTVAMALNRFFRTNLGLAMRAAGDNPRMARALGVDVGWMVVLGLAISNGLIALAGAVFAQYVGFVNIQMGLGIIVTGLASVMIGETLGKGSMARRIGGVIGGAVLFRLLIAGALRAGLDQNALKLVTALFVLVALGLPGLWRLGAPGRAPAAGNRA